MYERFVWLLAGMVLGFVLGYIVASHRDRKSNEGRRDEGGFMRYPYVANTMYLLVLVIVVWAAMASQQASNKVEESQKHLERVTACTQEYLTSTIEALNERTTYTQDQAALNVELQKAQSQFLAILLEIPPPTDARERESLERYFDSLSDFVSVTAKSRAKSKLYPYPTTQEYSACLSN